MIVRALLLVLFIFPCSVIAADADSNPLEVHKWALQFGIERELNLTAFEYGTISFKKQMSPKSALRFGVSLRFSMDGSNNDTFSNVLSVMYQRYINPEGAAKFYWGAGPVIHYAYANSERFSEDAYSKAKRNTFSGGLIGAVGIEWFANSVISFHAEYRGDTQYYWRKTELEYKAPGESPVSSTTKADSFSLEFGSTVLFGMSVYF